jgi:hypothetical protein
MGRKIVHILYLAIAAASRRNKADKRPWKQASVCRHPCSRTIIVYTV